MNNAIEDQFSKFGNNVIQIVPAKLRGPPTGGLGLPKSVLDAVNRVSEVDYANPLVLNFATVEFANERKNIFINELFQISLID